MKFIKELVSIYRSPLKKPKIKVYFGKIQIGTPYFLPRKWVKHTHKTAVEEAKRLYHSSTNKRDFIEIYNYLMKCKYAKSVKWLYLKCICLGYKIKWDEYRFEWPPMISFVILNKQLFITFTTGEDDDVYYEMYLNYKYMTKGSKKERRKQLINMYKNDLTYYGPDNKEINYLEKYLKKYI